MHNAHVIKWYRWQIWLARQACRPFAETVLIEWHNQELARQEVV
jgi:hypothetical protein